MKILHTSDWHLGKKLENFSRHPEQMEVLEEICTIAEKEQVHVILIAGDLFDAFNPPVESTELFYHTLKRLSNNVRRAIIAIAGNHDSPDRIEAPDPLARECGIIFAGYPHAKIQTFCLESGLKITESDEGYFSLSIPDVDEPLRIVLTPYANEYRLKTFLGNDNEKELQAVLEEKWNEIAGKYCDNKGVNILLTHLLMVRNDHEIPDEPEDEKPIFHVGGTSAIYTRNIPEQIQYTALGHLHRKQQVRTEKGAVVYSGSPLSYSFGEANQKKFVIVADVMPGEEAQIKEIELTKGKKLLRKRAGSIDEAIQWLVANPDALVELTLATGNFLTAEDRRRLNSVHDGIISIIPEIENINDTLCPPGQRIDLTQNMEVLFKEYFRFCKGQEPDEHMLKLFRETLAEGSEETI